MKTNSQQMAMWQCVLWLKKEAQHSSDWKDLCAVDIRQRHKRKREDN